MGVDVRNRGTDFAHMPTVLSELAAAGVQVHLIFLDCRDEVLIKRYSKPAAVIHSPPAACRWPTRSSRNVGCCAR